MRTVTFATVVLFTALPALAQEAPANVQGPRTLKPWMVACTDLPATSMPAQRLVVAGVRHPDDRVFGSRGQEIDINRTPNDGLAVGQRYVVRRAYRPAMFGTQDGSYVMVRTAGFATITLIDENNALANIDIACTPVELGDYLEVYTEPTLPNTAAPDMTTLPNWDDRSSILAGTDGKNLFGDGDTLTIERGTTHGVTTGQRFSIWRDFHNRLPLFYIGDVVIVEPGERTSKAVVVKAVDAIMIDSDVAIPRGKR
jgi:hypothetical protein